MKRLIPALALALALTGCLEKEAVQTIIIERDGSVTWDVLETDVRSTASQPEEREREEREYLDAARKGYPQAVAALTELGGSDPTFTLLRDRAPFALHAQARFPDVESAMGGLFRAMGMEVEIEFGAEGGRRRLVLRAPDEEGFENDGEEGPVTDLMLQSDGLRFVLADGTFDEAVGFRLEAGGRRAVLDGETDDERELRLSWRVAESE